MTDEELRWQIGQKTESKDYRIFQIYEQEATHPKCPSSHPYVVIDCPDWINVIALTSDEQVVLIRQYRHGSDDVTVEIPGGMVDPGETPLEAAKRELQEETGYVSEVWRPLGSVDPNPAIQNNRCWTFLALDATFSGTVQHDSSELIYTYLRPLVEIKGMVARGEICHALVLNAFFYLTQKSDGWKRPNFL